MKRFAIILFLMLMLAPGAQAARTYRTWAEDTIKLYSPREQDWTYVTPENYEENMELITSHGFDGEDARARYESGEIIFEAYHVKALKDGCLRLQVIETPYTRKIWDHTSLSSEERQELLDDLASDKTDLPFDFRAPRYWTWNGGGKNNYVDSGFVSMPPYTYESGRLNMQIRNGKAYVLSYVAHHPSTRWDRIHDAEEKAVRERLGDMNLLMDRLPRGVELPLEGPDTLQVAREGLVINGKSDKGAQVSVFCEGALATCSTESGGSFTAEIAFDAEGEYDVVITASKKGTTDTTVTLPVLVTRDMCTLLINQAPHPIEELGEKTISGQTLPGAEVHIDTGRQKLEIYADDEGKFSEKLDMNRYGVYPIGVKAFYEGLETAEIAFISSAVTDAKTMIKQAKERLTGLKLKSFISDPEDHVGEMISCEARIDEITYVRGGLKIRASTKDSNGKRQTYMLKTHGYVEDQIYEDMRLTFYGEVCGYDEMTTGEGETQTLPCVQVDCAQWLIIRE
ncbi:MAG: hypothetical protein IJB85_00645 [Clostridia bacterium]|nr:hypothetical protein [Clostridia bacterium]